MKKTLVLVCLAVLLCFSAVECMAEPPMMGMNAPAKASKNTDTPAMAPKKATETPATCPMMDSDKPGMKMEKGKNMGKGMKMGQQCDMDMCPMHCQMMRSMMEKTIVATSDGGVVVMMGNKLMKYDRNLRLVSENEMNMDMQGMKKMMGDMKDCPMCKDMQKKMQMQDKK